MKIYRVIDASSSSNVADLYWFQNQEMATKHARELGKVEGAEPSKIHVSALDIPNRRPALIAWLNENWKTTPLGLSATAEFEQKGDLTSDKTRVLPPATPGVIDDLDEPDE